MDENLIEFLASMDPDELTALLAQSFTPYQQEQSVLDQQMAMAQQLGQRQPDRQTPMGAMLGGLANAIGGIGGAYQQSKALEGQRALGERMRENAMAQTRAGLGSSPLAQALRALRSQGARGTSPADLADLMGEK